MRGQHDNNFGFVPRFLFLRKKIFQYRNVLQAGDAAEGHGFGIRNNSAKNTRFTFSEPNFVLNLAIGEDRLDHTPDVPVSGHGPYLDHHRHGDFPVEENPGRYIEIHTDIDELKIDDGRSSSAHKGGLKASGSDGHLLT